MKPHYIYSLLALLNVLTILGAWLLLSSQSQSHQLTLSQKSKAVVEIDPTASKLELEKEVEVEVVARPKLPQIPIYSKDDSSGQIFTTFRDRKDLIVSEYNGEWAEVVSSQGFPVWVRKDMVEKFSKGFISVIVSKANARTSPSVENSVALGKLAVGDILKISRRQGDWVCVWSPLKFRAWVKISDLGESA